MKTTLKIQTVIVLLMAVVALSGCPTDNQALLQSPEVTGDSLMQDGVQTGPPPPPRGDEDEGEVGSPPPRGNEGEGDVHGEPRPPRKISLRAFCMPLIPVPYVDGDADEAITLAEASILPWMTGELFTRLDLNVDGVLTLGEWPVSPPPHRTPLIWPGVDANGDKEISWEEAYVLPWVTPELFLWMDKNMDGVLTADDMAAPGRTQDETGNGPQDRPQRKSEGDAPQRRHGHGMLISFCMPAIPPALDINADGILDFDEAVALPWITSEMFGILDANADGGLSEDELPAPPPPPGVPLIPLDADVDGDGVITFDEAWALPWVTEALFMVLDVNGDDVLTEEELPVLPPPPERERNRR